MQSNGERGTKFHVPTLREQRATASHALGARWRPADGAGVTFIRGVRGLSPLSNTVDASDSTSKPRRAAWRARSPVPLLTSNANQKG